MYRDNYLNLNSSDLSIRLLEKHRLTKHQLVDQLIGENPQLREIISSSDNVKIFTDRLRRWISEWFHEHKHARAYYLNEAQGREAFLRLQWNEKAAIRILNYLDNEGQTYEDKNLKGRRVINHPFTLLFNDFYRKETDSTTDFYLDLIALFRQLNNTLIQQYPNKERVMNWMKRHPSGLDDEMIKIREENKARIINKIIDKIDNGSLHKGSFSLESHLTHEEKVRKVRQWWNTSKFHLVFAFRSPEIINEMLDYTLSKKTLTIMNRAKDTGIPFFINPHYLSLLDIKNPYTTDATIRDYIFYSDDLVNEFGSIEAWEKEDMVEPGKPNVAGWVLPTYHNIHRRYPEVAILIPDTVGRACGGLCVSCQRMYDFQNGHLNFNLDKLKPHETWKEKLERHLEYFEQDSQLRDILITGGDALMSSDKSLRTILDAVYQMARRKKQANKNRADGEKYAEMKRVRLGTRLPVYIPQRITDDLARILSDFKEKASKIGIEQFVIQTHFESAMEITPEVKTGIKKFLDAGWMVINQQVFTAAASRRGHTAKLRKVLNDIGVLTYYTFSVKGFQENKHNFATNARAVQEQLEEKFVGTLPEEQKVELKDIPAQTDKLPGKIDSMRKKADVPFLSTDRNVMNMPGVGKSLTFKTIGITNDGRRILEFEHDATRWHSPIIDKMGKVTIIESKSISELLLQLKKYGENIREYLSVFGYSMGESEERMSIFEYPDYDFSVTDEMTNLEI